VKEMNEESGDKKIDQLERFIRERGTMYLILSFILNVGASRIGVMCSNLGVLMTARAVELRTK